MTNMHNDTRKNVRHDIKKKANICGYIGIILAIACLLLAIQGKKQIRYLNNILSIATIVGLVMLFLTKRESDIYKAGIKLIWAGWIILPINLGGFLLSISPYYSEGLSYGIKLTIVLFRLILSCIGLYVTLYSNKTTGAPLAP